MCVEILGIRRAIQRPEESIVLHTAGAPLSIVSVYTTNSCLEALVTKLALVGTLCSSSASNCMKVHLGTTSTASRTLQCSASICMDMHFSVLLHNVWTVLCFTMYGQCSASQCMDSALLQNVWTVLCFTMYGQCSASQCMDSALLQNVWTCISVASQSMGFYSSSLKYTGNVALELFWTHPFHSGVF